MMIKAFLYIIIFVTTVWALESINITGIFKKNRYYAITGIFKKNRYYAPRVLYLIVAMALSYLVVNFLYDFFSVTKIV